LKFRIPNILKEDALEAQFCDQGGPLASGLKKRQVISIVPELPDITIYIEALEKRILRHSLERVQVNSPFLVRTAAPAISSIEGKQVVELRRLGKRICLGFEGGPWMVLHLMIAGRLHWKELVSTAPAGERGKKFRKFHVASPDVSQMHQPRLSWRVGREARRPDAVTGLAWEITEMRTKTTTVVER
jgi:formamidopyrimidine-DNA glycosylase